MNSNQPISNSYDTNLDLVIGEDQFSQASFSKIYISGQVYDAYRDSDKNFYTYSLLPLILENMNIENIQQEVLEVCKE